VDRCVGRPPRQRMERVCEPAVTPFEIWDLLVANSALGERLYEPAFAPVLREALQNLHSGAGVTRATGPLPPALKGFDAVFLAGGRALDPGLQALVANIPPVFFGADGVFTSAAGGFHLLSARGLSGWVLDLGQSQLKIATPERRWLFPRDSTRLRAAGEVPVSELAAQRRRLKEFLALKLEAVNVASGCRPKALVAALPTRLADDGTPLGGSYAGLRGYRELLPDVLGMLGLSDIPLLVLNDAELCGFAALADSRLGPFRKILVLTLGFGLGAALTQRSSRICLEARSDIAGNPTSRFRALSGGKSQQ